MYKNIFSSQKINSKQTVNRLVFGPHRLNFPEGHLPGPRRCAYYEERARGGAGLIIVEGSMVLAGDYPYAYALNIFEPEAELAYSSLAQTLKRYPLLLIGQLNHYGGQGDGDISRRPLLAPSPVPEVNTNAIPKTADEDDISMLLEGFAAGAKLLKNSGFDGVEVNAAQYALLRQFLSPLTNMRADAYGGTPENRATLSLQVLEIVRRELGPELILGLRLCGDEYAPWGGLNPEDWAGIAAYLAQRVQIDYIAVENGSLYSSHKTFAGIWEPEDYAITAASLINSAVDTPVIAGGSLQSPDIIESLLNKQAALADITRALIADPYYPQKLAAAQAATVKPCVLCRRGCHTHSQTNNPLACSVNFRAGQEFKPAAKGAGKPKATEQKLAVVGAGPAGLQAAVHGAELGLQVTLFERQRQIGGIWQLYSQGQPRLQALLYHFQYMLSKLHIEVKLEYDFSVSDATYYDAIIVAVGALPSLATVPRQPDLQFLSACQYLMEPKPAERALVWDTLGDWRAQTVCRKLSALGAHIQLISPDDYLAAQDVKNGSFSYWYQELATLPVNAYKQKEIMRASTKEVVLRHRYSGAKEVLSGVDLLIEAGLGGENTDLYRQLIATGKPVRAAGDCLAPRDLISAMREGYMAAEEVSFYA